jgi:hypothetical protein
VDKQICVEQELTELKSILQEETTKCSHQVAQLVAASDRASSDKHMLQDKLNSMLPPSESLSCQDLMCCNEQHVAQLNNYSNQIIQACLDSAATIPSTTQINND